MIFPKQLGEVTFLNHYVASQRENMRSMRKISSLQKRKEMGAAGKTESHKRKMPSSIKERHKKSCCPLWQPLGMCDYLDFKVIKVHLKSNKI